MGLRDSYAPGTFSWADLGTTDADGAAAFYDALLGWTGEELPAGPAGTYRMMRVDGHDVAGLHAQAPDQREAGVPPAWTSYVTVADAAAARAAERGGAALTEPFDRRTGWSTSRPPTSTGRGRSSRPRAGRC